MFFTLLIVTFALSIIVSISVVILFRNPIEQIFNRIIKDPISTAWRKYITFATLVVGISGGVRIYQLERYITTQNREADILKLTTDRWVLEVYRTIIETLESIAWMYLLVFIFALVAFVIVRGFEMKHGKENRES